MSVSPYSNSRSGASAGVGSESFLCLHVYNTQRILHYTYCTLCIIHIYCRYMYRYMYMYYQYSIYHSCVSSPFFLCGYPHAVQVLWYIHVHVHINVCTTCTLYITFLLGILIQDYGVLYTRTCNACLFRVEGLSSKSRIHIKSLPWPLTHTRISLQCI